MAERGTGVLHDCWYSILAVGGRQAVQGSLSHLVVMALVGCMPLRLCLLLLAAQSVGGGSDKTVWNWAGDIFFSLCHAR